MTYIDETFKKYKEDNPELGKAIVTCCQSCPISVWQIVGYGRDSTLICLCPTLRFKSYSISSKQIDRCSQREVALKEYQANIDAQK